MRLRRIPLSLLCVLLCVLLWALLLAPLLAPSCRAIRAEGLEIELQSIVPGLDRPVVVTHAGDGSGRVFVAEQPGRVRIFDGVELLEESFLDLAAEIRCCGESGLLGLAFHPDYAENGLFYVHYSDLAGDTVLAEYEVSDDPGVADPESARVLLELEQPFGNHNGGQLAFGPDGQLYLGLGDGGSGGDPQGNGQDPTNLLGTILRLDVEGTDPGLEYAIPADNPFVGDPDARDEIWAYGLRNPWRFSFDRETGDLWIGDVGQNAFEEINLEPAAGAGGVNYGWNAMEGEACFDPPTDCNDGSLTLPIYAYPHVGNGGSVTAGYRYRGVLYPELDGVFFLADFANEELQVSVPRCDGAWEFRTLTGLDPSVSTFGEDEMGEIYLTDYRFTGPESVLYRVAPVPGTAPDLGFFPKAVELGGVAIGATAEREVTVTNESPGPEAVTLASVSVGAAPFAVDPGGGSNPCGDAACLLPGESCTVTVTFAPAAAGEFTDELFFDANSVDRVVPLDAFSAAPCELESVLFVEDTTVSGTESFEACQRIEAGPGVEITPSGDLTLTAGVRVELGDGFVVDRGGSLTVKIDRLLSIE